MKDKEKNYITPDGFKKLTEEFDNLSKVERPEITKVIQWAASNGDRSENADYIYGKRRLREIDRRLRFLSTRIELAFIVDPKKQPFENIRFGATVKLCDEDGREKTVQIVGVDEIDTENGKISYKSPLGLALLGKEEGDEVIVKTTASSLTYEIISVNYV